MFLVRTAVKVNLEKGNIVISEETLACSSSMEIEMCRKTEKW
jgi:hypothetical protein